MNHKKMCHNDAKKAFWLSQFLDMTFLLIHECKCHPIKGMITMAPCQALQGKILKLLINTLHPEIRLSETC